MRPIAIALVIAGPIVVRPASTRSLAPAHAVHGSALNRVSEGFAFRTTVDAEQDGQGKASGKIVVKILDLSAHGTTTPPKLPLVAVAEGHIAVR